MYNYILVIFTHYILVCILHGQTKNDQKTGRVKKNCIMEGLL
jgi:hypothetical protein